jgi:hypothetical protein
LNRAEHSLGVQTGSEFVLDMLLRTAAELGPTAKWLAIFFAAVTAVFVLYVGIALWAVLRKPDNIRYQVFHDLLDLFRRGKQQ